MTLNSKDERVARIVKHTFDQFPLCIGPQASAKNPRDLPDTFPFRLMTDSVAGKIEQINTDDLDELLERAYQLGIEMGTPTANTALGADYAQDFLEFIQSKATKVGRALEIGAGVGYISDQLIKTGWAIDSIEPGKGYEEYWQKYGLNVINDFFPSPKTQGPYDLVVFYAVLEHISDVGSFLRAVSTCLAEDGVVVLAVPDCSIEIESGDPSMLLHEHYQYFTPTSLARALQAGGYVAETQASGYGRSIYASAKLKNEKTVVDDPDPEEVSTINSYLSKVDEVTDGFQRMLKEAFEKGTVGIYCPARALPILSQDVTVRFFDDSTSLHGKYYPPFRSIIESRKDMLNRPVDVLFIMSWTFGDRLAKELGPQLPHTTIYTMSQIVCS